MVNLKELYKNLVVLIGMLLLLFFWKYLDKDAPDAVISYGLSSYLIIFFLLLRNLFKANKMFLLKNRKEGKSYLIIGLIVFIFGILFCTILGNRLH